MLDPILSLGFRGRTVGCSSIYHIYQQINYDVELENHSALDLVLPPWFLRGELEGGLCEEVYFYLVTH